MAVTRSRRVSSLRPGQLLVWHSAVGCGQPRQCYRLVNPELHGSPGNQTGA